jgi:hypothetical protein
MATMEEDIFILDKVGTNICMNNLPLRSILCEQAMQPTSGQTKMWNAFRWTDVSRDMLEVCLHPRCTCIKTLLSHISLHEQCV